MASASSRILKKQLGQPGLVTSWQKTPTGKMPSVERLTRGLSPFPKMTEGKGRPNPAIIHLHGGLLTKLKWQYSDWLAESEELPDDDISTVSSTDEYFTAKESDNISLADSGEGYVSAKDSSGETNTHESKSDSMGESLPEKQAKSFARVLNDFMEWLGQHDTENNWCWLLPREVDASPPDNQPTAAGCYKRPPPESVLKNLMQDHQAPVALSQARIQKATGLPKAVMLTSHDLERVFREYLATL